MSVGTVTVTPVTFAPETELFVNKDIFLFHMFTLTEQIILQRHAELIAANADWANPAPSIGAGAYQGLALAQRRLDSVERVDVMSDPTLDFLNLIVNFGVFGTDPPTIATRIGEIRAGVLKIPTT